MLAPLVKERIDRIGWNFEDDSLQRGRSLMLAPFVKEMTDVEDCICKNDSQPLPVTV